MKFRLNRYLSLCGVASRRKAELLIESGEIVVNGKVEIRLQKVIDTEIDKVFFEGQEIFPQNFEYYKMNKPRFFLTTMAKDEKKKLCRIFCQNLQLSFFLLVGWIMIQKACFFLQMMERLLIESHTQVF